MFGYAFWRDARTRGPRARPRSTPSSRIAPAPSVRRAAPSVACARAARAYIVLGAIVTALGLLAILEEGLGFGSAAVTL